MSIGAPVSLGTFASSSNVLNGSLTVGVACGVGACVVVGAGGSTAAATATIADSKGNTWTPITAQANATSPAEIVYGWFSILTVALTTSDTITVTKSSTGALAFFADSLTGVSGQDGTSKANTGTGSAVSTAALTIASGSLVYFIHASQGASATSSPGAGFTADQTLHTTVTNTRSLISTYAASGVGTVTPTGTLNSSQNWAAIAFALAASSPPPPPGLFLQNTAEGGGNGVAISPSNSAGLSGSAFTAVAPASGTAAWDTTVKIHGTTTLKFSTGATASNPTVSWGPTAIPTAPTTHYGEYYGFLEAYPTASVRIVSTTGTARMYDIDISSTGQIITRDGNNTTIKTSVTKVPLNQAFRIEWTAVSSATVGQLLVDMFTSDADGTTPDESIPCPATQAMDGGGLTRVTWGLATSIANFQINLDDLGISSSGRIGPTGTAGETVPPATGFKGWGVPVGNGPAVPVTSAYPVSVFHDDFTDLSNWSILNGVHHNNEASWLLASNVFIISDPAATNGTAARIQAQDVAAGGQNWTSGYMTSAYFPANGRWKMRAKLPIPQHGMWPAFWLRPLDGGLGEIDIMEYWGSGVEANNATKATLWYDEQGTHPGASHQIVWPAGFDTTAYHVYEMQWDNTNGSTVAQARFYLDGVLSATLLSTDADLTWFSTAFERNMTWQIRLNLQVGGAQGLPDGTTDWTKTNFDIDYVDVSAAS